MDIVTKKVHKVIIEARKSASLTCVSEVAHFSDNEIVLKSDMGKIFILGSNLKIIKFDSAEGLLDMQGDICGIKYVNQGGKKESLVSRIFK